jgi:hypothetical protein
MRWIYLILGALLFLNGLFQLLTLIPVYFNSPPSDWPAGAGITTLAITFIGAIIFRTGWDYNKSK